MADQCANRAEERLRVALRDLDERDRDISVLQQQGASGHDWLIYNPWLAYMWP